MNLRMAVSLTTLFLTISAIAYYCVLPIKVQQFTSLEYMEDVPEPVRAMFKNQKLYFITVVKIVGRKIEYVYFGDELLIYARMQPLLKGLIANQRTLSHRINDGVYVISLVDGMHEAIYPWPVLTMASSKNLVSKGYVVLMPDAEALNGYKKLFKTISIAAHQHPWRNKNATIFWRGQPNGASFGSNDFDSFPRLSFLYRTQNLAYVDAGFPEYPAQVNPDFAQRIKEKFALKPYASKQEALRNKYLVDIDGQSCSYERMAWIMYSNSLLIKHQSDKVQWYYDRLKPGVNYLPIATDFSNIEEQYSWAESHPREVAKIIHNARNLALEVFSENGVRKATAEAFDKYQMLTMALLSKAP